MHTTIDRRTHTLSTRIRVRQSDATPHRRAMYDDVKESEVYFGNTISAIYDITVRSSQGSVGPFQQIVWRNGIKWAMLLIIFCIWWCSY